MDYTREEADIITADSFRELTYKNKKLFLAAAKGGGQSARYEEELIKICGAGVYNKIKEKFYDGEYRGGVIESLGKKRVRAVTIKSAIYPENLRHIDVPPLVLYARGNAELLNEKIFCIVGSRKSTPQALAECANFSAELSKHFVIATGVADGADSAAAEGALSSGRVICVLPGGHANPGPTLKKVENNGLSVSEFPPGVSARLYMFTLRNRLLAGLGEGVLVVSAGAKSGALSTAGYAANYGKDVFAFPYGIGVTSGEGCNNLIKNGAYLCDSVGDILSAMGVEYDKPEEYEELDVNERKVISALREQGELHAEKLADIAGVNTAELSAICAMLEIKGLIVRTGGNKYAAIK